MLRFPKKQSCAYPRLHALRGRAFADTLDFGPQGNSLFLGVRYQGARGATTESLVMRSRSGTVRRVFSRHDRSKLRAEKLSDVLAGGRSPEEQAEQASRARATLAAVAELPPRERDALVWTSLHGRSGREAARALGVSEEALRQLVFRARARARAAVAVFVPPVLAPGLSALPGTLARRLAGVLHRVAGAAASLRGSEAVLRLRLALAAGALVSVPVVALPLASHHGHASSPALATDDRGPTAAALERSSARDETVARAGRRALVTGRAQARPGASSFGDPAPNSHEDGLDCDMNQWNCLPWEARPVQQ